MKSTILFASESIALRSPHILVLLAIVALSLFTESATAMAMDPLKRARVTSSSLIPFPRVGRSIGGSNGGHDLEADSQLYFGQKRTGKSSLIPFPRVGRGGSNTWEVEPDMLGAGPIHESKRQKLIPFPRVGKRQGLIPFPRTGKRAEMPLRGDNNGHSDMLAIGDEPSLLERLSSQRSSSPMFLSMREDDLEIPSMALHQSDVYRNGAALHDMENGPHLSGASRDQWNARLGHAHKLFDWLAHFLEVAPERMGERSLDRVNDAVNYRLSKKAEKAMTGLVAFGDSYPRADRSQIPIPYPRIGKRSTPRLTRNPIIPQARFGRAHNPMIPMARLGRTNPIIPMARLGRTNPMIPVARMGRSDPIWSLAMNLEDDDYSGHDNNADFMYDDTNLNMHEGNLRNDAY